MRHIVKISSGLSIILLAAAIPLSVAAAEPAASQAQTSKASSEIEDLKNPNPNKRAKTVRELGNSGDPSVIPALNATLNDPSPKVRREVVTALASIRTPQSLDALIRATTDNDEEVRWLAVRSIEGYYTGQVPKSGFFAFMEKQYRSAKSYFVQTNEQVPPGTAVDSRAVSALDRVMMDTRFLKAAREATRGLGILLARQAVPNLVRTAHAADEALAREALNSLGKIKDTSAGPQLVDLLDSSNTNIQQDAAVTVGILRTRSAVPKLQAMYANSPKRETRQKALEGLAYVGDPVSVPVFMKALWDPNNSIRTSAAEGLARAKDQKALQDLLRATPAEKNKTVKLAMQFAVTSLGRDDYLSSMIQQLGSGDEDAAQSYLAELARNPVTLLKLYPYLNSANADVRSRLCNVLMYSGDQTSIAPLERASQDRNPEVAAAALNALRAVRTRVSAAAR